MLTNLEEVFQYPPHQDVKIPAPPDPSDIEAMAQLERDRIAALLKGSDKQPEPSVQDAGAAAEVPTVAQEQTTAEEPEPAESLDNGAASLSALASEAVHGPTTPSGTSPHL